MSADHTEAKELSLPPASSGYMAQDIASCFILILITTDTKFSYKNDDMKLFQTPLPN